MNELDHRRLRAPLFTAAVGLAIAAAVAVAAGPLAAGPVAAIALVGAIAYYWLGGTDTDLGALMASRADERQTGVRLRVRAFAGVALLVAAAAGAIVSAALHRPAWPYALTVGIGAVCFLGALTFYRAGGRLGDDGLGRGSGSRLDERQAAVVLHALQLAGIVTFVVATVAGVALSGRSGADALRVLALVFAAAVLVGFALLRPRGER